MLKLKTSHQPAKQAPKPEPSKVVKKDEPKPSIDLEEYDDEANLVEIKKQGKKQVPIQQTSTEGWQPSDEPKDLPTEGIGKKPNAQFKKQDEPAIEIRNEDFPDIAIAAELSKQSKKQKNLQIEQKQEQKQQPTTNNGSNGGLFTNSNAKQTNQTISNVQSKNPQINSNQGPPTFVNTKKQENTAFFQQQQSEQVKKTTQETQIQSQPQNQETQKSNPPQRQVNFSRNSNAVTSQPEQQKQLKVEESIPTFTNSKAKGIPPVIQQQQQQEQQQQQQQQEQQPQQQNEDEDSDGWEVVEKKGKSKGTFQRNQKKN